VGTVSSGSEESTKEEQGSSAQPCAGRFRSQIEAARGPSYEEGIKEGALKSERFSCPY